MKILCLGLCIVIAGLSGMLMYTMQAGPAQAAIDAAVIDLADEESGDGTSNVKPLISAQVGLIDELVESLQVAHTDLNGSKLRLDKREKNLQELYSTYLKLRQEVNGLLDELDTRLIKVEKSEMINFKKLAGVYAKMEPGSAAKSLQHMEEERVALILSQMDTRAMAAIMNEAITSSSEGSERVAEWSDALRRMSDEKEGA